MSRVETLTKAVKNHDRDLFCIKERGKILVCRQATVWETHDLSCDVKLLYSRRVPQVVMALTNNFRQDGEPIDLGIEPLIHRLKSIDLWSDFNESKNVADNLSKAKEIEDKDRQSKFEDFAREWRGEFKKAFEDVNTSTLDKKIDKRRYKNGSSQ